MSAHAIFPPSGAKVWMACTASAEGLAALPESAKESGEEAEAGTAAHDEIERVLGHMNGQLSAERFAHPPINPEHAAAFGIALTLNFVSQLGRGRLYIEQRVKLTDDIWGRCDIAHYVEATQVLTIVDFKNGFLDVDVKKNAQLMIYAAAWILTHKLPVRWIRLVVVQPNSFMPVPRVKQDVISADELHAFASKAAAIPNGPKTFTAGPQCRDCKLFGMCPPTRDMLVHLAAALGKPATEVPADQIALFKSMEKPIEHFFKALHKNGQKLALAGNVPKDMKLVTATTHRKWKAENIDALKNTILTLHGIEVFDLPTPAQAEEKNLITAESLAECSERPPGGPALAFADDKRPDWKPKSVETMFAGVAAGAK